MPAVSQIAGLFVIAAAVWAIGRRVDVRLALLLAGYSLGGLAGDVAPITQTFFATLTNEQFVLPICTAMGFAHVLRQSSCDRHLVHLLARPLQFFRVLLIPGAVLVGFAVNISVISQASTCVAVGTVLVPLLRSARLTAVTIGAALALGTSIGGEVLNPGAPEINTIANRCSVPAGECVERVAPVLFIQLAVALAVFWPMSLWIESRTRRDESMANKESAVEPAPFRVNLLKALVPIVPLVLLMVVGPPFNLLDVPRHWLVDPAANDLNPTTFSARLVATSMLLGTALAALTAPRSIILAAGVFFEGAGWAFARIISVIVVATCFGKGIELLHLDDPIRRAIVGQTDLVWPLASVLTLLFAAMCGSGYAATQSLYRMFVNDTMATELMLRIGAVVAVAAAAGRTMSPVAAVNLTSANLADTEPIAIARRVAPPLLLASAVTILVAWWRGG
jgi:DcuC family C4-dicarboxylate transporter